MTADPAAGRSPWSLDVGVCSETGGVRSHNEDRAGAYAEIGLFLVADGMGGHRAGDEASAIAVEATAEYLRRADADETSSERDEGPLVGAIETANEIIRERGVDDPEKAGMGSTITALTVRGEGFSIGHVGDSRAWRVRAGRIEQLTEDHSLVAVQLREGIITAEQAKVHPMRNVLSRSLGAEDTVDVDVVSGRLLEGDVFVLATDGLIHGLEPEAIAAIVGDAADSQAAADELVRQALEVDDSDNATAVVVAARAGEADPDA